jgi:hypothetical protein
LDGQIRLGIAEAAGRGIDLQADLLLERLGHLLARDVITETVDLAAAREIDAEVAPLTERIVEPNVN